MFFFSEIFHGIELSFQIGVGVAKLDKDNSFKGPNLQQ